MRVLVTGSGGFIGSHIAATLIAAGHDVVSAVRRPTAAQSTAIVCDMGRDTTIGVWLPRLKGIEAVINVAGILRENPASRFDAVHRDAPCALFRACEQAGVRRVIQISAIGDPHDGDFIRSKHEGDRCLSELATDWTVVRPSIVYATAGSYGGTSLLRAMAALPWVLFLPGDGQQRLQPIYASDLGRLVVQLMEGRGGTCQVVEAVGPEVVTLESYLRAIRRWLGIPTRLVVRTPLWLIRSVAWVGERMGRGPLGLTMFRMLQRGNVGQPDAAQKLRGLVGFTPRSLNQVLATNPAHVQDRWHARLYFLRPALRLSLAFLWLTSGLVGLMTPMSEAARWLVPAGIPAAVLPSLVTATSVLDLLVGTALVLRWQVQRVGMLMLLMLLGYTILLGVLAPGLWLEPFGGLLKNIPLLIAVLAMITMEDQR